MRVVSEAFYRARGSLQAYPDVMELDALSKGKGKGKGKDKDIVCYNCGRAGHRSTECLSAGGGASTACTAAAKCGGKKQNEKKEVRASH